MADRLWILGADDPEMAMIEQLLRECGEAVAYATVDGERVHGGNAYRADSIVPAEGAPPLRPAHRTPSWARDPDPSSGWDGCEDIEGVPYILVECALVSRPGTYARGVIPVPTSIERPPFTIDHHRPGDPGYGRLPEEFLAASSIGQVIALLRGGPDVVVPPVYCPPGRNTVAASRNPPRGCPKHGDYMPGCPDCDPGGISTATADETCWHLVGEYYTGFGDEMLGFRIPVPREYVLAAAADHCLAAAYQGRCPGVDPDELMRWRIETRAKHQGRDVSGVMADVDRARVLIWACARAEYPDGRPDMAVYDLRDAGRYHYDDGSVGDVTTSPKTFHDRSGRWEECPIPELPEAACREGVAYLATVTEPTGREKVVMGGCTTPELVQAFLDGEICPDLVDRYGDPQRGFAGGYVSPAKV